MWLLDSQATELVGCKVVGGLIVAGELYDLFPKGKGVVCLREFSATNFVFGEYCC